MGAISFSIDENLVKELRKFLPLEIFIETGTFLGDSLELPAGILKPATL